MPTYRLRRFATDEAGYMDEGRIAKLLAFLRNKVSKEVLDAVELILRRAGTGIAAGAAGESSDDLEDRLAQGGRLPAMDQLVRGFLRRSAWDRIEGERSANAHAASLGLKRPRILG